MGVAFPSEGLLRLHLKDAVCMSAHRCPYRCVHWNEEKGGDGRAVLIGTFDQLTPGYIRLLSSVCWL